MQLYLSHLGKTDNIVMLPGSHYRITIVLNSIIALILSVNIKAGHNYLQAYPRTL